MEFLSRNYAIQAKARQRPSTFTTENHDNGILELHSHLPNSQLALNYIRYLDDEESLELVYRTE
jgi:hypothetical protein